MGYPCRLNCARECDGCGKCEHEEEYVLYCDHCGREIENLEQYVQLGDYAYCQECVDDGWRHWYRSPGGWASRVRGLRKKHGMKQYEFAKKIGVSKSLISAWECGERHVKQEHIDLIFEKLGEKP